MLSTQTLTYDFRTLDFATAFGHARQSRGDSVVIQPTPRGRWSVEVTQETILLHGAEKFHVHQWGKEWK